MSHANQKSSTATNEQTSATMPNGPNGPTGKASAVAPKLSDENNVELTDMLPSALEANPEDDIMQLARLGDIQGIEKLYDSGKYDPAHCDAEGITPLHVQVQSQLIEVQN